MQGSLNNFSQFFSQDIKDESDSLLLRAVKGLFGPLFFTYKWPSSLCLHVIFLYL